MLSPNWTRRRFTNPLNSDFAALQAMAGQQFAELQFAELPQQPGRLATGRRSQHRRHGPGHGPELHDATQLQGVYALIFDQQGLMAGMGLQGSKITPYTPDY
jgi:hypothetical protein